MKRIGMLPCRNRSRRGTTVVETALVLPVFLLFVLGLIELGHAQMVKNLLRSACRQAARIGSTEGHTTADVEARVKNSIGTAVDPELVEVFVKDASSFDSAAAPSTDGASLEALPAIELTDAAPRQMFMVRAKIHYNDIAIVPNIPYLGLVPGRRGARRTSVHAPRVNRATTWRNLL